MIGAKPLTEEEIKQILFQLKSERNKCLFILGIRTGFRISELLSLTIADCQQYGEVREEITVHRCYMKGKRRSRTVVLHAEARESLKTYLSLCQDQELHNQLFPFTRMQAHRILKKAVEKAQIRGRVSSHSMRKSFAKAMYSRLDQDLINTQKALGHKNINSTIQYLSFNQDLIDKAIKGE